MFKKNRRRPPKRKRAGTLNMYIFLDGLNKCRKTMQIIERFSCPTVKKKIKRKLEEKITISLILFVLLSNYFLFRNEIQNSKMSE